MKKVTFFLAVVLSLRGSPQTNNIDTLYYLHHTSQFIPEYAIATEIFYTLTRFYPQPSWELYKINELHLMLRPLMIGRTIQSISFYKDTLQQLVFTQAINKVLDSSGVYPNWFKIIVDNSPNLSGYIEVPAWWGDLCEVQPEQISGNSIGFYEVSQSWGVFHDLPIKLIIERVPVSVENEFENEIDFKLYQNYPNPFNPSTRIQYQVASSSYVTLKVYDVLGNEFATLVDEYKPAGSYEVEFQSTVGSLQLASGVYYYQLRAGEFDQIKKMILMR